MVEDGWGTETVREVKTNWNRELFQEGFISDFQQEGGFHPVKLVED